MLKIKCMITASIILLLIACNTSQRSIGMKRVAEKSIRQNNLKNVLATYASPPRFQANGRVDVDGLVKQLKDINANTYNWLIWKNNYDWNDLKIFLPVAEENSIRVWVTIVPPTESRPYSKWSSMPYEMDYIKWAEEIAVLSLSHKNLVAWSIDDFAHNLNKYTVDYTKKMIGIARKTNPVLAFIPCLYYRQITGHFISQYKDYIDGVLFPYRAESGGSNLTDAKLVKSEIEKIKSLIENEYPVFIDIYATAHSSLGASSTQYLKDVLDNGLENTDGVLIYTHQDPTTQPEEFQIIKTRFAKKRNN